MGSYSETVAAKATRDILSGLNYLHNWGYVVRNLKPENLLFENLSEDSNLKISDFALSSIISPEVDISSVCGSPGYAAPEILKGERYGSPGDMWSVGVIVYILLCGYEPFENENATQFFKQILKGQYEFHSPCWDDVSINGRDFIRKLLIVDPKKRLTSAAAKKNCWVTTSAARITVMEDVVERIKEFNEKRRAKKEMLPLAVTPGCSRMCSRATPYRDDFEYPVPPSTIPDIQVVVSEETGSNAQEQSQQEKEP